MSDIVERAEAWRDYGLGSDPVRDLLAELKTARAENVRLHYELAQALTHRDLARNQRDDFRARSTGMSP